MQRHYCDFFQGSEKKKPTYRNDACRALEKIILSKINHNFVPKHPLVARGLKPTMSWEPKKSVFISANVGPDARDFDYMEDI